MAAPSNVRTFVERFRNLSASEKQAYTEAELCSDLLLPLFKELGWDVYKENSPSEVLQQRRLGAARADQQKAPDYNFSIGNELKFYMDAKRPRVPVLTDMAGIRQIRRYGWSKKLLISVISDFEHLCVYDTRFPIKTSDKPTTALLFRIAYTEYEARWEELWNLLGRDNVARGSIEKLVGKEKKGVIPVDDKFLDDLDEWRQALARDLHKRNSLSEEDLNTAVQRILDRIVFLRIGEDRGMEAHGQLRDLVHGDGAWTRFQKVFTVAEERYDSELFSAPLPEVQIGDAVLKDIIGGLYEPAPYEFSVISSDILGSAYERFLGKVISVDGRGVRVEWKPEYKKSHGIYYTPSYIVEYIVGSTVDKLLEGKTLKEAEQFAVVDPACGSGSFLIGAFQHLVDWHIRQYRADEERNLKSADAPLRILDDGTLDLSVAEKQRILLNNIYGVDLDPQAVEVAKLSLGLKLLENERSQPRLFGQDRALPDLSANIKCGNSLVSTDYEGSDATAKNVFNWEHEFAGASARGGFDAVIGNPPYVRQERLAGQKEYFEQHYTVYASTADLYAYFIERAHGILKDGGMFGMICSNKFIKAEYGRPLRKFLATQSRLLELTDFGELPVFENAATFPVIIITAKEAMQKQDFTYAPIKTLEFSSLRDEVSASTIRLNDQALGDGDWLLVPAAAWNLLAKLRKTGMLLGKYVDGKIFYGIKTGLNEAFVIDGETRDRLIKGNPKSEELIKPFIVGDDVRRYHVNFRQAYVIVVPSGWTKRKAGSGNAWNWFCRNFPAISQHLESFQQKAQKRQDQGEYWWELRSCDYYKAFSGPKIIYPDIAKEPRFHFDEAGYYSGNTTYLIPGGNHLLVGLLNSSLVWWYLKHICSVLGDAAKGGRLRLFTQYLSQVPIPSPNDEKGGKVNELVRRELELHSKLAASDSDAERMTLRRQIEASDRQIDQIVYDLYGLTGEEIRIIESTN